MPGPVASLCAGVAASLGQRATQSGTAVKYSNRGALSGPQHHSRDRLMCVNDFSKPNCREFTPKRSLVRSQYRPLSKPQLRGLIEAFEPIFT